MAAAASWSVLWLLLHTVVNVCTVVG